MLRTGPISLWCVGVSLRSSFSSYIQWLTFVVVLVIYVDSIAFVSGTAILSNGPGVSSSATMCTRAILLCLGCYMTTKVRSFTSTSIRFVAYIFKVVGFILSKYARFLLIVFQAPLLFLGRESGKFSSSSFEGIC
jgi:hypothetical protein